MQRFSKIFFLAIIGLACVMPAFTHAQLKPLISAPSIEGQLSTSPVSGEVKRSCWFDPGCWMLSAIELISLAMLSVLEVVSLLIQPLLTGPNFITNDLVKAGWPFVLGIANMGFVLALLFIAILTIFGLGGYDVRRALVRLLVAAILINFSLLIAGVILDISRLLMAIILRLVGDIDSTKGLGLSLLNGSKLFNTVFHEVLHGVGRSEYELIQHASPFQALKAMWLIAGTTIIFVILAVSLLTRWLMLIFLLIVSPLAYLAMAMPGMYHRADQWWKLFLTYVLYGPVVAFILAIAIRGGELGGDYVARIAGATPKNDPLNLSGLLTLFITLALMFLSTQAAKFLGLAGALAMTGFIKNQAQFARRHPILTGAVVAGPLGAAAGAGVAGGAWAGKGLGAAAKKATIGVVDEAVAGRAGKAISAYQKVAAGTATEEDYKELEKHPVWRTLAAGAARIPGFGGRLGIGSKLQEREERLRAAQEAIKRGKARVAAGRKAGLGSEPALDHRTYLSGIDHRIDVGDMIFMIENAETDAENNQVKIILQDPAVIKKLQKDTRGQALLTQIQDADTDKLTKDEIIDVLEKRHGAGYTASTADIAAEMKKDRGEKGRAKAWSDALDKGISELAKKDYGLY